MKEKIINLTITNIKEEGLKFSIDTLAKDLKISKKTIYKIFHGKEELALSVYEKFFADCALKAQTLVKTSKEKYEHELLSLYLDTFIMTNDDIFNKFKLNTSISNFAKEKQNEFWLLIKSYLLGDQDEDKNIKIILDSVFANAIKLKLKTKQTNEIIEKLKVIL
ncbi:MAG: TetR/AcrR family transcriptional regulator [Bacilli bacterium]